ncbi:hypothetical protein C8R45DRAFT_951460 [Mycena sanguinolenta]|nr:hypothetical protein C8R45DRAFT_951460 [Mycena sanguinolenta]
MSQLFRWHVFVRGPAKTYPHIVLVRARAVESKGGHGFDCFPQSEGSQPALSHIRHFPVLVCGRDSTQGGEASELLAGTHYFTFRPWVTGGTGTLLGGSFLRGRRLREVGSRRRAFNWRHPGVVWDWSNAQSAGAVAHVSGDEGECAQTGRASNAPGNIGWPLLFVSRARLRRIWFGPARLRPLGSSNTCNVVKFSAFYGETVRVQT